jgi:hypothetical protein
MEHAFKRPKVLPLGEGGGGRWNFWLFSSSQCVPFKFSQGPQILNQFPQMFLIVPHLFCPKLSSFHVHRWTKGDSLHLPKKLLFWGAFKFFFGRGNGPIKMAHCKEKKSNSLGIPIYLIWRWISSALEWKAAVEQILLGWGREWANGKVPLNCAKKLRVTKAWIANQWEFCLV